MAAFGLQPESETIPPDDDIVYLWPENAQAWQFWIAIQTQWRHSMKGITGLDYAGVIALLNEFIDPGDERRSIFAGIRACEIAALSEFSEQRERAQLDGD